MRLLTNKEDLKELIKKINNTERRDFFLKRLTDNPDANWREKVKLEVFDELKIENNNNEDAAAKNLYWLYKYIQKSNEKRCRCIIITTRCQG
ncbi:hypothetical protein NW731_04940 [Mycoplasmopsis felis]|nr:hypothetical protein [Mycoplasmopsis felis]MCU9937757.1 hypothetical protein [Mycoplasmopsis felis]